MVALARRQVIFSPHFHEWPLTVSGNELTDATRTQGVQGDGRAVPDSSYGIWEATTNLCTNGGFETNTTGWAAGGSNTIARVAAASEGITKMFGDYVAKCTYQDNTSLASYGITLTDALHTGSVFVWIPSSYDGTALRMSFLNYTSGTSTGVNLNMNLRDQWQRIPAGMDPDAGDLVGNLGIYENGTPGTAGKFIYIDGVQIELQPIATPYVETDGGTASRTAARVRMPVTPALFTLEQGWVAVRARFGFAAASEPGGTVGDVLFAVHGSDVSNRIVLYYREASNTIHVQRRGAANADGVFAGQAVTATIGAELTAVGAWIAASGKVSVNGAAFTSDDGAELPDALTTIDVGNINNSDQWDGEILWIATGEGTLTDADAATLHAYGNAGPNIGSSPRMTGLWTADNGVFLRRF